MKTPVIYHIPHSSAVIPEGYRNDYCTDLERELLRMTDLYTEDLFLLPGERLVFPVSRLVCDVERFRDDAQEPMARIGMGAVYTSCSDLSPLRTVSARRKEEILKTWYDPHHEQLEFLTRERLDLFGRCLIADCHSFSGTLLPYEEDRDPERPDICIGTDPFHTPEPLALKLGDAFRAMGYTVRYNRPYAGAIVPLVYYQKDERVASIMIEVNRSLYMDGAGRKLPGYDRVKRDIAVCWCQSLRRADSQGKAPRPL